MLANITGINIPKTWKYELVQAPVQEKADCLRYGQRYMTIPKDVFNISDLNRERLILRRMKRDIIREPAESPNLEMMEKVFAKKEREYNNLLNQKIEEQKAEINRMLTLKK